LNYTRNGAPLYHEASRGLRRRHRQSFIRTYAYRPVRSSL